MYARPERERLVLRFLVLRALGVVRPVREPHLEVKLASVSICLRGPKHVNRHKHRAEPVRRARPRNWSVPGCSGLPKEHLPGPTMMARTRARLEFDTGLRNSGVGSGMIETYLDRTVLRAWQHLQLETDFRNVTPFLDVRSGSRILSVRRPRQTEALPIVEFVLSSRVVVILVIVCERLLQCSDCEVRSRNMNEMVRRY